MVSPTAESGLAEFVYGETATRYPSRSGARIYGTRRWRNSDPDHAGRACIPLVGSSEFRSRLLEISCAVRGVQLFAFTFGSCLEGGVKRNQMRVVAGVIEREDMILIGQRRAGDRFQFKWEFPGGKMEPDEDPKVALARECRRSWALTPLSVRSWPGMSTNIPEKWPFC